MMSPPWIGISAIRGDSQHLAGINVVGVIELVYLRQVPGVDIKAPANAIQRIAPLDDIAASAAVVPSSLLASLLGRRGSKAGRDDQQL
jgi:hypothetical protein